MKAPPADGPAIGFSSKIQKVDAMLAAKQLRSKVFLAAAVLTVAVVGLSFTLAAPPDGKKAIVEFTADGQLKQPIGYRQWEYVGTPLTPNELNGGEASFPDFHNVYLDPESFAHYKETGKIRDGAVIVKELVAVGAKEASSGKGYFMGDYIGLETAVKDSKRFKDEPGNWGYFTFGHKYPLKKEATLQATAACNSCHQSNAKTDWIFSQYYPVLRAASPASK